MEKFAALLTKEKQSRKNRENDSDFLPALYNV